jgi:hypothetical protein
MTLELFKYAESTWFGLSGRIVPVDVVIGPVTLAEPETANGWKVTLEAPLSCLLVSVLVCSHFTTPPYNGLDASAVSMIMQHPSCT